MDDPLNLRDYPDEIVRLACEKCGRRGPYWKPSLITRFGPDMGLPELCVAIAQCERQHSRQDPCGVRCIWLT